MILATAGITFARYPALPERIPIHFGLDGTANNYGPRYMAWLLPAMQAVLAVACGLLYANGNDPKMLLVGVCALAVLWRAQLLIISAATSGAARVSRFAFWIFFCAVAAVGAIAANFV